MSTAVLDRVAALRAEYDAQARQLSEAMKERDAAEKALLAAQQRVNQLDMTTTGISYSLRLARQVEAALRDPRPVLTGQAADEQWLNDEIACREKEQAQLDELIASKRQAIVEIEQEVRTTDWNAMTSDEEQAKRDQLSNRAAGHERRVLQLGEQRQQVHVDLVRTRRELRALTSK